MPKDNWVQFGFTDRPIVLRVILRYVIRSSYDTIPIVLSDLTTYLRIDLKTIHVTLFSGSLSFS